MKIDILRPIGHIKAAPLYEGAAFIYLCPAN